MASSGQGALFELVARGVKDSYFVKDAKESTFPYDARYHASCPHLAERRTMVPINATAFGGTIEVEIDPYGDIMTQCALEVELPTWIPPQLPLVAGGPLYSSQTVAGLCPIVTDDAARDSYGYVNGIGYFLFESIQFYQDQFLIQEWSGDGLYAQQCLHGSLARSSLELAKAGVTLTSVSPRDIQLRAAPDRLLVKLPLPGMQCPEDGGFPLCAMPHQTFRFKLTLRRLEDLVVCSDETKMKPAPWNVPQFRVTGMDGSTFTFAPQSVLQMGPPRVLLSTVQHYVSSDTQRLLRESVIQLPFRRTFQNRFTFGDLDYAPLDRGGVASVTRRLDARHPTERILWFFRSATRADQNRLDDFSNDYPMTHVPATPLIGDPRAFYAQLKLLIAGKDRESLQTPLIWERVESFSKEERSPLIGLGAMQWSLGAVYGTVYPAPRQPEGTVNFTSADRPTLYMELAPVDPTPRLAQRSTELRVFLDGWNVYEVQNGRGRSMFAN